MTGNNEGEPKIRGTNNKLERKKVENKEMVELHV